MQKRKQALFFFSNPENAAYLSKALIEKGWNIKGPAENIQTLEDEGVPSENLHPSFWGDPNSFVTPSLRTILGIRGRNRDQTMMEKHDISRIDLVCVDFHSVKKQTASGKKRDIFKITKSESAKAFLLMAAIEGGKIPVCEPYDRKLVADWITNGMPNKHNMMLRLIASSALRISRELMDLGMYCDHLRT